MATTRKTGERTKRKAGARAPAPLAHAQTAAPGADEATDQATRWVLNRLRINEVPVVLASDPPVLPPCADFVEVHSFESDISIVFARLPFQLDFEKLQNEGGEAIAIPVSSVTMSHAVADTLIQLIQDARERSK